MLVSSDAIPPLMFRVCIRIHLPPSIELLLLHDVIGASTPCLLSFSIFGSALPIIRNKLSWQ